MKSVVFDLPDDFVFFSDINLSKFYGWDGNGRGVFVGPDYKGDLALFCKKNHKHFFQVRSRNELTLAISGCLGGREDQAEVFEFDTEIELTNWLLSPIV